MRKPKLTMVQNVLHKGKKAFECESCSFHYPTAELAQQCEDWCTAHHSCNLEITKHAL